jgi:hypothetical protein
MLKGYTVLTAEDDQKGGWKKTYQGEGPVDIGRGNAWVMTTALNGSLSDVITLMLTDQEFLSVLKTGR